MSNKHIQLLRTLFHDPISNNLHWREIESLLRHVGAEIEPAHGSRFRIVIGRFEMFLHHPHHGQAMERQSLRELREFLARAGVTPSAP